MRAPTLAALAVLAPVALAAGLPAPAPAGAPGAAAALQGHDAAWEEARAEVWAALLAAEVVEVEGAPAPAGAARALLGPALDPALPGLPFPLPAAAPTRDLGAGLGGPGACAPGARVVAVTKSLAPWPPPAMGAMGLAGVPVGLLACGGMPLYTYAGAVAADLHPAPYLWSACVLGPPGPPGAPPAAFLGAGAPCHAGRAAPPTFERAALTGVVATASVRFCAWDACFHVDTLLGGVGPDPQVALASLQAPGHGAAG